MQNILKKNILLKYEKILKRKEFLTVNYYGIKINGFFLILTAMKNTKKNGKIGFIIPKKIGKASIRNLLKRRLKYILRYNKKLFQNKKLIIIIKKKAIPTTPIDIKQELLHIIKKLKYKNF